MSHKVFTFITTDSYLLVILDGKGYFLYNTYPVLKSLQPFVLGIVTKGGQGVKKFVTSSKNDPLIVK
jgi:hypothetical protein